MNSSIAPSSAQDRRTLQTSMAVRLAFVCGLMFWLCGCLSVDLPREISVGRNYNFERFDPFPQNDLGPVTNHRPLGFTQPRDLQVRVKESYPGRQFSPARPAYPGVNSYPQPGAAPYAAPPVINSPAPSATPDVSFQPTMQPYPGGVTPAGYVAPGQVPNQPMWYPQQPTPW